MKKTAIIFFSLITVVAVGLAIFQYAKTFQADFASAYTTGKPLNGHLWSEMECSQGLCVASGNKVGIGTDNPLFKLHVVNTGGFGSEDSSGIAQAGNVPIVAQSGSTAFGIINGSGRQAFALNIDSDGGATGSRGIVNFYDKTNGSWNNDISLNSGKVGIGTASPSQKLDVNGVIKGTDVCSSGICLNQVATYYNTNPLYNSTHTIANCNSAGGTVLSNPNGTGLPICQFTNSSGVTCPSGWTQFGSWSTTTGPTCIADHDTYTNNDQPVLCGYPDCGPHSWSNTSQCVQYCTNGDNNSCGCYTYSTCGPFIQTQIGCY